jgi:hypothetical protein
MVDVDMRRQRAGGRLWTIATTKAGFGYSCSPLLQFGPWPGSTSSRRKGFIVNASHRLDRRRLTGGDRFRITTDSVGAVQNGDLFGCGQH